LIGQSFKDLVVWQRAIELTTDVYKLTSKFPDAERFGLTNQMRRASVSIASNIAEGYGRATKGEYVQFLGHARGSCSELETQLVIAKRLGFGTQANVESADSPVQRSRPNAWRIDEICSRKATLEHFRIYCRPACPIHSAFSSGMGGIPITLESIQFRKML